MAEAVPAVALLFDDVALGEQLRSALSERGARIVHEGPLGGLSRELLASLDADVMVVNLDDEDDSALDRLDEVVEGERPRVVFNDAQASRRLEGWDRARWARHLAMKVLAIGDADPPRPPAPADTASANPAAAPVAAEPEPAIAQIASQDSAPQGGEEARQAAVSETLAAELEALLASDEPMAEADEFGTGLNYAAGEDTALHDGNFGFDPPVAALDDEAVEPAMPALGGTDATEALAVADTGALELDAIADPSGPVAFDAAGMAPALPAAAFKLDHLELAPIGEDVAPPVARATAELSAPRVPDSWTLLDDATPAATEHPSAPNFGIEKVSASEYLAPNVEESDSPIHPGMSLELVSLEEAIAPAEFEPAHAQELALDMPGGTLQRVVVLGATTESTASVGEFLAALPVGLRATVLHTQHLAGRPADGLVEYFASQCALPVRLAEQGLHARTGEVIVVPSDCQVGLGRDGSVELQPIGAGAAHAPSIDASFTQAAQTFGRDVVAIVFAGRSTDAVAGCQAVHDRGGQVWVEASGSAHPADMVSGVQAEQLSHHAGTPRELAARLAEHLSEGQP